MTNDKKILDDISKLASSTFSTMVNMKNEISNIVRDHVKSTLKGMDFVTRSEFNALKKQVQHASVESKKQFGEDKMKKKATKKVVAKKPAAKKPAAKKAVAKKKK